jgi:hypothetical protein
MAMYYPQNTVVAMGPTGIAPRSQYNGLGKNTERHLGTLPESWQSEELLMECKAGTVVIIHYDVFHKGTPNKSIINRYMFKFQFTRMEEPTRPTWNTSYTADSLTTPFDAINSPWAPIWSHVWTWLCGGPKLVDQKISKSIKQDDAEMNKLLDILDSYSKPDEDPYRLNAAYRLAQYGKAAIEGLITALHDRNDYTARNAYLFNYPPYIYHQDIMHSLQWVL